MNQSELEIMFHTGLGLLVKEARGALNIQVSVPPVYNETYAVMISMYAYGTLCNHYLCVLVPHGE